MITYSIDDEDGNTIAEGIKGRRQAKAIARDTATEFGKSLWLYRDSSGAQAYEATEIKPATRICTK